MIFEKKSILSKSWFVRIDKIELTTWQKNPATLQILQFSILNVEVHVSTQFKTF